MNVTNFIQLLQQSGAILSPKQTRELEDILEEYPYFQAARALHLKGLKNLDSYKYNDALKVTAGHTADREVLFDYITGKEFTQHHIANAILGRATTLEEKEIIAEEVKANPEASVILGETEGKSPLPQNLKDAEQILNPALFKNKEQPAESETDGLNLGKPIAFTKKERYSFNEWLQLTSKKPIARETPEEDESEEKKKKFDLLDKFIESKPRIIPKEDSKATVNIKESAKIDQNQLMTETLAKVYLEQKKYKKAIQAFKILRLKYPEKSSFFADRIREVKRLQKDKD